jgi:DHA2 family multidrug resistance protein-like MFS transporter
VEGLALLTAGIISGAVLVRYQWRRPAPLLPLDLLRIPILALSLLTSFTSFGAQMLAFITLPFFMQGVLGLSVTETGLLMTPWPLATALASPLAGHLADRYPAGLLGGIGLALLAAGLFTLSTLGDQPETFDIIWRMALCGLGFGFFQAPNNRTIIASAPRSRSGATGGMLATARLLGQTTGAVGVAAGFHWMGVGSSHVLLMAGAVAAAVAAVISLLRLRTGRPGKTGREEPTIV